MAASDIFNTPSRWFTYQAELHIVNIVGGIPKDPDTVRAWLKARMELGDTEIMAIVDETLEEMNWTQAESAHQVDELIDAVMERTAPKGNSFKAHNGELVWEGRALKAALREACNVCWPGVTPWPGRPDKMRKGLASYFVERVEVVDRYLALGRSAPDIAGEQRIKHISGPQGRRSAINIVDICEDVKITATLRVLDDCILPAVWAALWGYVELGGVGADRARGDGRCELVGWRRV